VSGGLTLSTTLPDAVLTTGGVVVAVVRASSVVTEARLRVPGWPLWRSAGPVGLLVLHDVAAGISVAAALAAGMRRLTASLGWQDGLAAGVDALVPVVALVLSSALLHRRRGVGFRSLLRPRNRVVETCPTLRSLMLDAVERAAVRGTARWISAGLERCRRRCGATPEQLLPALWPPVRLRLREAPGVPRTEVALLLLQAQAVVEDASPSDERMLTLLHLVHHRAGRRGVRGALDQARRSPVRHGRSGAAAWGSSPQAVPKPVQAAVELPADTPVQTPVQTSVQTPVPTAS
jgi:hypothetical protein